MEGSKRVLAAVEANGDGISEPIAENLHHLLSTEHVFNFLRQLLKTDKFVLGYIEDNGEFKFVSGEMEMGYLLMLKSYLEIETFAVCAGTLMGEDE